MRLSRSTTPAAVGVALAAVWFAAGCGDAGTRGSRGGNGGLDQLAGEVRIDGSSTVYPMSEAVAKEFEQRFRRVSVKVGKSGTGGGFKEFTRGNTDISDASRPITADEVAMAAEHNVSFVELPIAYDGLTVVVNPRNTWVEQLTVEQLQKIFLQDGAARRWNEVDPGWPDTRIEVFSPGTDSGTFDYFREVVAPGKQAIRSDMSTSEEDNDLVRGVAGNLGAIGYFGASYYFNNRDQLKAVPIVNPETGVAVHPTPESIESGEYAPFSRPLFIYVNVESLKRPEMKKFIEFYLDEAPEVARQVDYVALPQALYDAAREHYRQRWTGTHFLTPDGEKRSGPLQQVYQRENLQQ